MLTEIIGLDCDAQSDDGYLKLMILENSAKAQDVLKGLRLHLTELLLATVCRALPAAFYFANPLVEPIVLRHFT